MLAYVGVIERETTITIDGYSSAKTLLGVMRDISRIVGKYNKNEASGYNVHSNNEAEELLLPANESFGGWFCEIEEVSCASEWNDEKDEMEYKDGYHYYFVTRFVK